MKIECNSVIGIPVIGLNFQCLQCRFNNIFGPDICLPYPWYQCHPDIQFKKSKCEVFKL